MRAGRGRIVAKAGAEAVHATGLLDAGLGVVVKVVDGNRRALAPAAIEVLRRLDALDAAQRSALEDHARIAITNVAGANVGEIAALTAGTFEPLGFGVR